MTGPLDERYARLGRAIAWHYPKHSREEIARICTHIVETDQAEEVASRLVESAQEGLLARVDEQLRAPGPD